MAVKMTRIKSKEVDWQNFM